MEEGAEATADGETATGAADEGETEAAPAAEQDAATAGGAPSKDETPASATTIDMEVPEAVYGWLAGPDGAHIQELERLAGAQIQALQPEEGAAAGCPRRLQLSGAPVAVERARVLLEERLRSAPQAEGAAPTGSEAQAAPEVPEAEGRPAVTVAGRAFKDRDQLVAHVKALQASVTEGAMLGPEDAFFVFHLITYHPNFSEKMTAPLVGFKYGPHENFPGSKCFFMVRVDGSEEGISIMKCVDSVVPKRSRNESSGEAASRPPKRQREEEVADAPAPARPRREIQQGCVLVLDGVPADIEYDVLRDALGEYGDVRFLEFIRSASSTADAVMTETSGDGQKAGEEGQGPDEDVPASTQGEESEVAATSVKEAPPPAAEDSAMETVEEGSKPVSSGTADAASGSASAAAAADEGKEKDDDKDKDEAGATEGTATEEGKDAPEEAREKKTGATKARVRYADSSGASRALAELKEIEGNPVSLHLLAGDEEREFWERLWQKADARQQGKGGKGKGKDSKGGKGKGTGKGKGGKGKGKKGKSW